MSTGSTSRTRTGRVTNTVASTIAGRPNSTGTPAPATNPNQPEAPHSRISAVPTTTGETANGRSTAAASSPRPRNRPRARVSARARPNTTFSGTVITTISSDRRRADTAAGVVIQSQNCPGPPAKARTTIIATGTSTSAPTRTE